MIVASFNEPLACFGGFVNQVPAHHGKYAAIFPEDTPGTISQLILTHRTATYDLSFWIITVNNGIGYTPNSFSVSWGGVPIFSATDIVAPGYTKFTFVGLKPTGDSTDLSFTAADPPAALRAR